MQILEKFPKLGETDQWFFMQCLYANDFYSQRLKGVLPADRKPIRSVVRSQNCPRSATA